MAVRDQGTASLGKCHFSHLQNLALKLQFKKKKIPGKKRSGDEVGGGTTHQLLSTRTQSNFKNYIPRMYPSESKIDYFRAQHDPFSIRRQESSLIKAQLLLTSLHYQTGTEKGMGGQQLHTCGQHTYRHSELLFASNPDAKLSHLIRASSGGKPWLE